MSTRRNAPNNYHTSPLPRRLLMHSIAVALLSAICIPTAGAQNVSVLYNFSKNGTSQHPQFVTPAQGRDGALYGTTEGGANGIIFRVSTTGLGGQLFVFDGTNGADLFAGLTLATNGNFYGAAPFGGSQND